MRLPVLFAALALAAALPGAALAQTPPPAAVATNGVSVADARTWLTGLGGSVGEPVLREGVTSLHIADQPLPWNLTFYACGPTLCDDVQYSAIFTGPITADQINAWNRDNRFLKAFFVPAAPGGEASAVVQYDVVLTSAGTEQLREPTVVWLQLLRTFAQSLVAATAPATAAPAQ
ncbi:hypothetical protein [Brevundimonas sp.]|uniref:hypothetical protein n=1 Tax=Brevundimonas sp. TaxID=1871086 RepID=UPI003F6FEB8D